MSDRPSRRPGQDVISLSERARSAEWERDVLERIFTDSPVPLQVLDADGSVRRQNDAHAAFEAAVGQRKASLTATGASAENATHDDMLKRALAGEALSYEFIVETGGADGVEYFERILAPISGHDAATKGVVCVTVDITERRRLDEDRKRLHAQVLHSQKLESLGILAGGIAHDFNNLLVAVLGNAGLLLRQLPADSPLRGYAQGIETAAQRAAEVARQMLAYSGKTRFAVEPVNLNRLLRETAELLRISVSRKATLVYEFAPDIAMTRADPTQLRQVVMNLLTNASESLEDRPGRITLRTGNVVLDTDAIACCTSGTEAPPGDYVFLEVEDDGKGMSPETMSRVFDPFFTTKLTGRGLGLAGVFGIVRGHRGCIRLVSRESHGTTFRIHFPVVRSLQPMSPARDVSAPGVALPPGGLVLVVDDEPDVRRVAMGMLASLGLETIEADDGFEAIRCADQLRSKLLAIVLDMTMPLIDGREVCARVRKMGIDVPIVLTSGYEVDDISAETSAPNVFFLSKPYGVAGLLGALSEALAAVR
jgi:two-component system cell cycle sensor histidine kinase/response regulator CckA